VTEEKGLAIRQRRGTTKKGGCYDQGGKAEIVRHCSRERAGPTIPPHGGKDHGSQEEKTGRKV